MTANRNLLLVSILILILCSVIQCLNKEVYEDSVDYDIEDNAKNESRDGKSDFDVKFTVVNTTIEANNHQNWSLLHLNGLKQQEKSGQHLSNESAVPFEKDLEKSELKYRGFKWIDRRLNKSRKGRRPSYKPLYGKIITSTDPVLNITNEMTSPSNSSTSNTSISSTPSTPTSPITSTTTTTTTTPIPMITSTITTMTSSMITTPEIDLTTISDVILSTDITITEPTLTSITEPNITTIDLKLGNQSKTTPETTRYELNDTSNITTTDESVIQLIGLDGTKEQTLTQNNTLLYKDLINESDYEIQKIRSLNNQYIDSDNETDINANTTIGTNVMSGNDTKQDSDDSGLRLLVDSDDEFITVPYGVNIGIGNEIFTAKYPVKPTEPTTRDPMIPIDPKLLNVPHLQNAPIFPIPPLSPLLPITPYPPPIYPIMPPRIPEYPGFQTIWVPIQVQRDSRTLNQMWKHTREPNFIERGHIRNPLTGKDGTPNSWWRRPRPEYCFEPIAVHHYCADRLPLKKWSYSEADERCYRYVDYCSSNKLNSFNTLQECLISCWRARN